MIQGTIIRVAGPVVDVQFTAGKLPALQEALTVTAEGTERTMEVTQHVNETTVRCIMLSASEGLGKGMTVTATGHGLTAPVGEATLGRMFDPLGRPGVLAWTAKAFHFGRGGSAQALTERARMLTCLQYTDYKRQSK